MPSFTRPGSSVIDYNAVTGDSVTTAAQKQDIALNDLYTNIVDGTAAVKGIVQLGTTATTAALGNHLHTGVYQPAGSYAASGANSDITSLPGLTTPLSVAQGGTGATTASNARTALGLGSAALLASSAVAQLGAVCAYTRQQYAVPVVLVDQAGAVALDAELHQDVDITATAAVSFDAPEHGARGMYMTMTLRAATALGIAWDTTVYKESRSSNALTPDVTLPTAFVAGKAMILQFRCIDGARWLLMGKCEEA